MNLTHTAWRERPVTTAVRVTKSLVRRAIPPLRRPSVPYDGGRSQIHADLGTALGLGLYRYGAPRDPDLALLRLLLRPGDVAVDGGANIGLFTLVAAACVGPSGKVIAFEPVAATRDALLANVQLNGFGWVDVRSEALDAQRGERELVAFGENAAGLSSFRPESTAGGHVERVPTTTLDDAVGAYRGRVRVLKIDLEGAEYDALRGAHQLLVESGPELIVEVEPKHLARAGSSADAIAALLREQGYRFFSASKGDAGPVAIAEVHDLSASRGGPNVYATRDLSRAKTAGVRILPSLR